MFTSNINELTDKHFPIKTVVRHTTDKPWVSDRFRDLIRRRQHAWKAGDQALYRLYRNSPLPKKKPPEHIETDLRPITLTAVLCKQMEEFVVKWVWDIVQDRVDPNQYSSIKKSSTTHALVDLLHQCYTGTDASKQYARKLLLDFSKAFDLINHNSLLQKFASFGLPNILMKWIASFLTERTQQVKLCNAQSDWNYIHGGVPQSTKLGPVLFVDMINDLQTKYDSYKYVDNTCIVYTGSDSQAPNLQEAADAAYLWTIQNDMKINKRKTKELFIDFSKRKDKLANHTHRRNRHSASNRDENTWHYHH